MGSSKLNPIVIKFNRLLSFLSVFVLAAKGTTSALAKQYDEDTAKLLVRFSSAAYCGSLADWNCNICGDIGPIEPKDVITFGCSSCDSFGFATFFEKAIYIVFRGTNWLDIKNIATDLELYRKEHFCDGCKVHAGFLKSFTGIYPKVVDGLDTLQSRYGKDIPVYITGHSLGSSLAAFTALALKTSDKVVDIQPVYTFGSPRLGNDVFANFFESHFPNPSSYFRVTHRRDPIPHVPQKIFGYSHMGQEVFYPEIGKSDGQNPYKMCDSREDETCSIYYYFDPIFIGDHIFYVDFDIGTPVIECMLVNNGKQFK